MTHLTPTNTCVSCFVQDNAVAAVTVVMDYQSAGLLINTFGVADEAEAIHYVQFYRAGGDARSNFTGHILGVSWDYV